MHLLDARDNCRIDTVGEPMTRRPLYLGMAGSVLAGTAAAAVWSGAGAGDHAGAAALLAATAFATGCVVGRRAAAAVPAEESTGAVETARLETLATRREVEALQSSVAHDLRSPIGAVLNFATVLELDHGPQLDDGGREVVRRIRKSAESALSLLDGLSRLAAVSRAALSPVSVEIEPLVRRAYAEARLGVPRPPLSVTSLPARAIADPELLRIAFTELFDNALKFSGERAVPSISVGGRRDPDGTLVFWVADEGAGFEMRFAGKLFAAFERLHSREEFPGAGVGLAMVRRIAERHGGRVWAEGEPGRGARVFLSLPERQGASGCA